MAAGYAGNVAASALTGGVAKTVLGLIASATDVLLLRALHVSVDASTTVLVELCESTQAVAGTSTGGVWKQLGGFAAGDTTTPAGTYQTNYTVEPTVLTRLMAWRFTGPGPFIIQYPLGREPQTLVSGATKYKALAIRLTASIGCNADATAEIEE